MPKKRQEPLDNRHIAQHPTADFIFGNPFGSKPSAAVEWKMKTCKLDRALCEDIEDLCLVTGMTFTDMVADHFRALVITHQKEIDTLRTARKP
jgi:hypothetical protein